MSWRCLQPEIIRQPGGDGRMRINCGACLGCETRWRKGWVLRMILEAQSGAHARFLTLTYEPGVVPMSLPYQDVAGFLKRLRKNSRQAVRFFCAGEFGETYNRPHWHLILFSPQELMPVGLCSLPEWPFGGVMVGDATPASMAYVAGYSLKKRTEEMKVVISRRPGIGLERSFELGVEMARQLKKIHEFPGAIRSGKHLYPLHRSVREVMETAYTANGGTVVMPRRRKLSLDMEAQLIINSGEWRGQRLRVQSSYGRSLIRLGERLGQAPK